MNVCGPKLVGQLEGLAIDLRCFSAERQETKKKTRSTSTHGPLLFHSGKSGFSKNVYVSLQKS